AGRPDTARRPRTRREPAPPGRGLRHRHARTGARHRGPGGRRRGGQRDRGSPRPGGAGRGGAPGARARRGGARAVTANRLVVVYSRALAIGGPLLLVAILIVDPRWTGQLLEIVVMTLAAVLLRGAQVPLSKYSYLAARSEEHTSELQSHLNLVCRLLLEKKKNKLHVQLQLQSHSIS